MRKQLSKTSMCACLALTGPAFAGNPTVTIESVSTPTVHVVSTDNLDYDAIAGNTYAYTLQIYGDCGSNTSDITVVQGNTPTNPPQPASYIDVSDLVHPTRWLPSHFATQPDTKLPITWPLDMRQRVVAACNDNLATKMLVGIPRGAVLAQTWKLGKVFVGSFFSNFSCTELDPEVTPQVGSVGGGAPAYARVECDPLTRDVVTHPVPGERSGDPDGGSRQDKAVP